MACVGSVAQLGMRPPLLQPGGYRHHRAEPGVCCPSFCVSKLPAPSSAYRLHFPTSPEAALLWPHPPQAQPPAPEPACRKTAQASGKNSRGVDFRVTQVWAQIATISLTKCSASGELLPSVSLCFLFCKIKISKPSKTYLSGSL